MARITATKTHTSGIALGGIGSGRLPLCLPGILATVCFSDGDVNIEFIKGNLDGWEITVK